jgi:ABC-type phosphate/phosphonate transport system substrate-binding protein
MMMSSRSIESGRVAATQKGCADPCRFLSRKAGPFLPLIGVLLVLLCPPFLPRGEAAPRADLVVAFSPKSFIDVDLKDALSAFRIYVEEIAKQVNQTASIAAYDTIEDVMKQVENGQVDMVSMYPIEYLRLKNKQSVEPAFGMVRGQKPTTKYLLLVHASKSYQKINDLKGKRIVLAKGDQTAAFFLNTLLLKQHLGEARDFFSQVEEKGKASQSVLAVFFGQADSCLVAESSFQTMVEMNPQLGKDLKAIVISPDLLDNMALFRKGMNEEIKVKALEVAGRLKTYPRGKQILMLFKVDDLAKIKDSDLQSLRDLINEHDKLKAGR